VVKLGVVLLVLGGAHAGTIAILSRIRDRLREDQLTDELVEQGGPIPTPQQAQQPVLNGQVVNGLEEEAGHRHPAVSPPIEETRNPYSPTS
jgi:hypothetical protein